MSAKLAAVIFLPISKPPDHSVLKCVPSTAASVVITDFGEVKTTAASSPMPTRTPGFAFPKICANSAITWSSSKFITPTLFH